MSLVAKQHNWLIHKIASGQLAQALKTYGKGDLLDIGCGDKPYESMARPFVSSHIGVDQSETSHDKSKIDIVATAYDIPVGPDSHDTILCTYVLEHLEEPSQALAEAHRILKPGGHAIYTVPLFWHLHEEPRDFFRFTKYGLRYLFEKNGFEVLMIRPLTGFSATFAQELVYFLYQFRRGGAINPLWWIVPPVGHLIQAVAFFLNKVEKTEKFTCEYLLIARKA